MLSSTLGLGPLGPSEIGKHPLVTKLLKGIYNARPPAPRYANTWDPAHILAHFDAMATTTLSRIQISRKVVTLLAITTLLRCTDIASIQASSIITSDTEASFVLGKPRKTQHAGPLTKITVPAWPRNQTICPVACLKAYISSTSHIRDTSNADNLFISTNKPFRAVGSSTIARWIKIQLQEAGIDTTIFNAHSSRGAAASKAASKGIPINSILKQGQWANESTFAKFYRRDIAGDSNATGRAILDQEADSADES